MSVILRGVPKGYNWGWFSREDPRMHLQIVDRKHWRLGYKIWLEDRGKKIIEPAGPMPAEVLRKLEAAIALERKFIEDQWTRFMIDQRWLHQALTGSVITLTAYPAFPGSRFRRTVDLADYLRGIYDPTYPMTPKRPVQPEEVTLTSELNAIEIWPQRDESSRYHIYLPPILWQDK